MAKVTGFLEHNRAESKSLAPERRLRNFDEFVLPFPEKMNKLRDVWIVEYPIATIHVQLIM